MIQYSSIICVVIGTLIFTSPAYSVPKGSATVKCNHRSANKSYLDERGDEIYLHGLSQIFTGVRSRWIDGSNIHLYLRPSFSIEHSIFIIDRLDMTPYTYKKKLARNIYSGRAKIPTRVMDDTQMETKIMNVTGSIGYIDEEVIYNFEGTINYLCPDQ